LRVIGMHNLAKFFGNFIGCPRVYNLLNNQGRLNEREHTAIRALTMTFDIVEADSQELENDDMPYFFLPSQY
jgi:hypothetical protein